MKNLETIQKRKLQLQAKLEAAKKEEQAILKHEEEEARREEEKNERLVGKLISTCAPPSFYSSLLPWLKQNEAAFIRTYTYRGETKADNSELEALRKFLTERAPKASTPAAE